MSFIAGDLYRWSSPLPEWNPPLPEWIPPPLPLPPAVPVIITNNWEVVCPKCEEEEKMEEDLIDHPSHYCHGKIEAIDVIEDWQLDFHLGCALKYIARAGHKDDEAQDLKKAVWYLTRRIEQLEKELDSDE